MQISQDTDPLVLRGAALALVASVLGPDPDPLASGRAILELRMALEDLDATELLGHLERLEAMGPLTPAEVHTRYVRLFEKGRVPPYELTYVPPGAASHQAVLADVAAFYEAFGMRVKGDRPDHCAAELEFLSYVTLAEASCRADLDDEGAKIHAGAARSFIRDHVGSWLPMLAARLDLVDPEGPYAPLVEVAAGLVAAEARWRRVIPVRPAGIIPDWSDDEFDDTYPVCGTDGFDGFTVASDPC